MLFSLFQFFHFGHIKEKPWETNPGQQLLKQRVFGGKMGFAFRNWPSWFRWWTSWPCGVFEAISFIDMSILTKIIANAFMFDWICCLTVNTVCPLSRDAEVKAVNLKKSIEI